MSFKLQMFRISEENNFERQLIDFLFLWNTVNVFFALCIIQQLRVQL